MLERSKYVMSLRNGICPKCEGTEIQLNEVDGPISVWSYFTCTSCNYRLTERLSKTPERIAREAAEKK